jgi:hypothetical protein
VDVWPWLWARWMQSQLIATALYSRAGWQSNRNCRWQRRAWRRWWQRRSWRPRRSRWEDYRRCGGQGHRRNPQAYLFSVRPRSHPSPHTLAHPRARWCTSSWQHRTPDGRAPTPLAEMEEPVAPVAVLGPVAAVAVAAVAEMEE